MEAADIARLADAGARVAVVTHQGSHISRMSPTATPPAAIFAFFDISVASFAALAAL